MARKIDEWTRDMLARCTITGNNLALPEQLARPDYEKINKALVALGGKWNRKAKAHVFDFDPRELLGETVETGAYTDRKQELQYFPTPPGLAARMVALADVSAGDRVLEPSAGQGAIALQFREGVRVDMVEIDKTNVSALQQKLVNSQGDYSLCCADFLVWAAGEHKRARYDAIVMNPPFRNNQDLAHIRAAWDLLKPGGRLVALTSPHWTFATDKASLDFSDWMAAECLEQEEIPSGTFKDSGTEIRTVLLWGPKRTRLHAPQSPADIVAEYGEWVENNEALHDAWQASGLSLADFIAAHAAEIRRTMAGETGQPQPKLPPWQAIIPGAEHHQHPPRPERMRSRKPQRSLDFGLFAEGVQLDIVDAINGGAS